jgi:putative hydrolase of HD superfamily
MAMLITDPTLNSSKMIHMAMVHDVAEAIVGDITPSDGISKKEKQVLERKAMQSFVDLLGSSKEVLYIQSLWEEYEMGESREALLVKDLDKFEMIVQAFEYEKRKFFLM